MNNNRVVEQVLNGFWIFLGICICAQSIRHQVWSPAGPGSGFIPFLAGILIGVNGILLFVSERSNDTERRPAKKFWNDKAAMRKVLFLLGSLCMMALLMPILGFLLTSIIITILMIRVIESKKWITVIVISITSCLLIYSLFHFLLQIKLPKGILSF
jgi:putative tricarboxylic transport membrane protein